MLAKMQALMKDIAKASSEVAAWQGTQTRRLHKQSQILMVLNVQKGRCKKRAGEVLAVPQAPQTAHRVEPLR